MNHEPTNPPLGCCVCVAISIVAWLMFALGYAAGVFSQI